MNARDGDAATESATQPSATKPEPVSVAFAVGNTYRRLPPSEASYDKLTGRHLKVHDWTLYVDVLAGQDPDVIDRVTFDMRDDSFATTAFTCHCPIRIRTAAAGGGPETGRAAVSGEPSGADQRRGQATAEGRGGESRPSSSGKIRRWRFSTRQQTFGPVDVQISIRGRGGCRCTVPYRVVLDPGGYECPAGSLPPFVEKRPHQPLKPLKMMDASFALEMRFALDDSVAAASALRETAQSVYSRSKIPLRLLLDDGCEDFSKGGAKRGAKGKAPTPTPWLVKLVESASMAAAQSAESAVTILSILSPALTGGHGLNECYKMVEGLPSSRLIPGLSGPPASLPTASMHVQIDASTLSVPQIAKVCQHFVKYEEAMDSFMPRGRRGDGDGGGCKSNKRALGARSNKERNRHIAECATLEELVECLNPDESYEYKLNLRKLVGSGGAPRAIEFRQHPSSKDKTTVTNWIRFCTAFVRNAARLRPPTALKATTSLEEEFDLAFEYVVKDRALRNFYRDRRDAMALEEEKAREAKQRSALDAQDGNSLSTTSLCGSIGAESTPGLSLVRKRSDTATTASKRAHM